MGAFFLTKRITVDSITCKVLLWDTAGQQQFQKLAKTYYSNAAAAILTYDVTQPSSLLRLRHWLDELQRNTAGRRIVIAIAACKCDLKAAPGVIEEARLLAQSCDALYVETSAKDNTGVHQLFSDTASRVLHWQAEAVTGTGQPIPVIVAGGQNDDDYAATAAGAKTSSTFRTLPKKRMMAPTTAASMPSLADSRATPETVTSEVMDPVEDSIVDVATAAAAQQSNSPSSNVLCEGSLMVCGTDDKNCSIM